MYEMGMEPPYIIQPDTLYSLTTINYDTIPLPSTDLAGNPRIAYGRIDMGAYEFKDTTVHVKPSPWQENNSLNIYPNPFYHSTFISFQTNKPGKNEVFVYNLKGQKIRKLMDNRSVAGKCTITWDGKDDFGFEVPPGTYIIKVILNGELTSAGKVVRK